MKKINIAIVGATGLVGQKFLEIIDEYQINVEGLKFFASEKSRGKTILFQDKEYLVETIKNGSFSNIDYALFSAGGSVSIKYAKQANSEGAIVIDNSSAWRMDKDVPLVVPEVNLSDAYGKKLISNPNCSTIQCVVPLKVLDEEYGIKSIEYNTYQAVSGAGQKGLNDLLDSNHEQYFPYDIKETCIPQIDVFLEDGYTKEEHKMIDETRKILHHKHVAVSATCVRVPVPNSHGVSIRVTLNKEYDLKDIRELFKNQKSIIVLDNPSKLEYPLSTIANGNDFIYIGRIRRDKINQNTLLFYTVADNIRKGAASNALQIMKGLIDHENTI
jgi:aspartate-semialdehyde dehydrogenase